MEHIYLNTVTEGTKFDGFYVIKSIVIREASNGTSYLDLTIGDNSGTMDAKLAAKIIADGKDANTVADTEVAYAKLQNNAESAATRGYVDTVINAADTRKYVIGAFDMLYTKRDERPGKKHTTV